VEGLTGLYVFFKTVCDLYDLLPAENYKLPPEAEGLEAPPAEPEVEKQPTTILKPNSRQRAPEAEEDNFSHVSRTNTRRHIRSSPSTGSAVTTVLEADEEDGDGITRKMKDIHITAPETVDEEPEVAEVPVIVEQSVMAEALPQATAPHHDDDEQDTQDESEADQTVIEIMSEDEAPKDAPDNEEPPASTEETVPEPEAPAESQNATDDDAPQDPSKDAEDKPGSEGQDAPASDDATSDEAQKSKPDASEESEKTSEAEPAAPESNDVKK
jgi:hypothetical protein